MSDPIPSPAPVPPAPPAPAPDASTVPVDMQQIKSRLNLADTASDLDVVTTLLAVIGELNAKYEALLGDTVKLEDQMANRDLADFAAVITPTTREFWKTRAAALQTLTATAAAIPAPPPQPAAPPPPVPLANRAGGTRPLTALITPTSKPPAKRGEVLRNRAAAIMKEQKVNFDTAFRQAEAELAVKPE